MEEWNIYAYWGMYAVGTFAMFLTSLFTYKKFRINSLQAYIFTVIAFFGDWLGAFIMGKVYELALASIGVTKPSSYAIYGAVFVMPVVVMLFAVIAKQPWRKILDMVAMSELFARAFGKLGCLFIGCCAGVECNFGIYNFRHETTMFPSQIFEFITMLIIIVAGFCFAFRSKKYVPGSLYPLTALLYGGTRFFWEFTRYYTYEAERYLILGMSLWQFCSLITVMLSIVWLVGIKKDWLRKAKAYIEVKQIEKVEAERKARAEKRKNKNKKKNRK